METLLWIAIASLIGWAISLEVRLKNLPEPTEQPQPEKPKPIKIRNAVSMRVIKEENEQYYKNEG